MFGYRKITSISYLCYMRISEVYDIETYLNTFIYCSYVIEEDR